MRAERGRKLCGLTKLRNNLPNAALSQRAALAEEEMPIRKAAPGRDGISPENCPLAPAFGEMLAIGEIRIERVASLPSPAGSRDV